MCVDGIHWLIFIKSQERICQIQNKHEVYRITDILIEPFNDIEEVNSLPIENDDSMLI